MEEGFSLIFVLCFSMAKYILSGSTVFYMYDSYLPQSLTHHKCPINIYWMNNQWRGSSCLFYFVIGFYCFICHKNIFYYLSIEDTHSFPLIWQNLLILSNFAYSVLFFVFNYRQHFILANTWVSFPLLSFC